MNRIAHCLAVLLVSSAAASQADAGVQELRRKNAELARTVAAQARTIAALEARLAAAAQARSKPVVPPPARPKDPVRRKAELVRRLNAIQFQFQQQAQPAVLGRGLPADEVPHPLLTDPRYAGAVARYDQRRTLLAQSTDPAAARRIVDLMSQDLLAVRRALWEIEQRNKPGDPAKPAAPGKAQPGKAQPGKVEPGKVAPGAGR